MSELAIAALRFGLLLALWILIVSIVTSQGRDLVVGRRNKTRLETAQRTPAYSGAAPTAAPEATAPVTGRTVHSGPPTPAPRLARTLVLEKGPLAGREIDLQGQALLMGRAQDADLVLEDDYASGRHARLFPQGTRWFLEDLGSTNGTFVDGNQVTRALPVGPGDSIRIGKTVMEIKA
ncbi:FHA domain-containing protein [Micrococcus luteus]